MKNEIIHERSNGKNADASLAREKSTEERKGHRLGQLMGKGSASGRGKSTKNGQKLNSNTTAKLKKRNNETNSLSKKRVSKSLPAETKEIKKTARGNSVTGEKTNQVKKSEEKKTAKKEVEKLKIIPLGGIGEVGKNMTVIEYGNDMIVVDCGLVFPGEDLLGVDYVIPDTTYLEKNIDKIRGFFITHGHEDHIGATPYVFRNIKKPVYGTEITLALIESKLIEHHLDDIELIIKNPGDVISCGCMKVELIKVSHSIEGAVALAIHTPVGVVIHTGDFKVDYTPIDGKIIDLSKFASLGKNGVLALLSDSTNAECPGYTISEKNVGQTFEDYFSDAKGRIIIATFASNIHRLQQVVDVAKKYNRKVCLSGRSMVKIAVLAKELGYLDIKDSMLISFDDLPKMKDNKVVILTTGSQGESMSGLVRMAAGEHPKLAIKQGDLVIISASPIPGNERGISDVVNMLYRQGAIVVNEKLAKVHVSGHACQEELKLMISLVRPTYFIPVHGEYRHLYNHAYLAEDLGVKKKNIFITENGKSIELTKKTAQFGPVVSSGSILIDGLGVGDVGQVVLRDRKVLSSDGLFIVVMTINKDTKELIGEPDIISRGFIYMKESEDLLEEAREVVADMIDECGKKGISEWIPMKGKIKKGLNNFLYAKTKRSPMILPIIVEI